MTTEQAETLAEFDQHKKIIHLYDAESNLEGFIAIHRGNKNMRSFGATRVWDYSTPELALKDALNLSRLMSYKSALAGLPYGGAKAVLINHKMTNEERKKFLKRYSYHVNELSGDFITGSDMGISPEDLSVMGSYSPYFVGFKVDPVEYTAQGLFNALEVSLEEVFGSTQITGRTFAIQGVGKIGKGLLKRIYEAAEKIYITDLNGEALRMIKEEFPKVEIVDPEAIYELEVDVFSPCGMGRSLNQATAPTLRCKIIVGGANNQLESPEIAETLHLRSILYAPDYLVNAGGLISVVTEFENDQDLIGKIDGRVANIKTTLRSVLDHSKRQHRSLSRVANEMAETIINSHA